MSIKLVLSTFKIKSLKKIFRKFIKEGRCPGTSRPRKISATVKDMKKIPNFKSKKDMPSNQYSMKNTKNMIKREKIESKKIILSF